MNNAQLELLKKQRHELLNLISDLMQDESIESTDSLLAQLISLRQQYDSVIQCSE